MSQNLKLRCRNTGSIVTVPFGTSLDEAFQLCNLKMQFPPVCARVNNKVQGMNYRFYNNKDVEFLDITSASGMRTYTRTLFMVLTKAVEDLYPGGQLVIGAEVSNGYYCELRIGRKVTEQDAADIMGRMQEIVKMDKHLHRIQCPIEEAIALFKERGMDSKVKLLESQSNLYTYYYRLCDTIDYYYSCLLTHTSQLYLFDVMKLYDGLLLRIPSRKDPNKLAEFIRQDKMYGVISEYHRWQEIVGVSTVGELNEVNLTGGATELINVSEALQERKLNHIADEILARKARLVLVAGPSSSGKTTTSKRLSTLMKACGLKSHTISIDDYVVNRVDTPKDENGNYDFECIEAVDTDLFNRQMNQLLSGEEVNLPHFNFKTGEREYIGDKLRIGDDDVIILEGNHALNPTLSAQVPDSQKYRIYVSPLTTVALDDHNCIPTPDIRLLRRIVRDNKYRGFSALDTIRRYPSVSAGEEKWIMPYQEFADATFNSALLYELAVIKAQALPLLEQVSEKEVEYAEASRMRKFLSYFISIPADEVPPASLLREFAGGSSFKY